MFRECLQGNLAYAPLLSINPRKTIYHCKADKLKFAKILMFLFFWIHKRSEACKLNTSSVYLTELPTLT